MIRFIQRELLGYDHIPEPDCTACHGVPDPSCRCGWLVPRAAGRAVRRHLWEVYDRGRTDERANVATLPYPKRVSAA